MSTVHGPYRTIGEMTDHANHYRHLGYSTRINMAKNTFTVLDKPRKTSFKLTGSRITSHMNEADYKRKYGL